MKHKKTLLSAVLASNLFAMPLIQHIEVLAQTESEAGQVSVSPTFNLFLQVDESGAVSQSQISYDIIDEATQSVVYSYRSDQTQTTPLELPAGDYLFRLYDGGDFEREGQTIQPYEVQLGSSSSDQSRLRSEQKGEIVTLNDGSIVYDYAFTIEASSEELKPIYDIYLVGDQVQAPQVPETQNPSAEKPSTDQSTQDTIADPNTSESSVATTIDPASQLGGVEVYIHDQAGNPIANTGIVVGDQEVISDDQGKAIFNDLPAGEQSLMLGQLPDYLDGYAVSETVNIIAGQMTQFDLTLTGNIDEMTGTSVESSEATLLSEERTEESTEESSTTDESKAVGRFAVQVYDQEQAPVEGVEILVISRDSQEEYTISSDQTGLAHINELPVGDYTYQVTQTPDSHAAEGNLLEAQVQAGSDNLQYIQITKQAQVGQVKIKVVYRQGQAIVGAKVQLGDQSYTTNDLGAIEMSEVAVGNYPVTLQSVPENDQLADITQELEVVADQVNELIFEVEEVTTTTAEPTTTTAEETTTTAEPTTTTAEETTTTAEPTTTTAEETTTTAEPKATLSIQVVDQKQQGVEGVVIRLTNLVNQEVGDIVTDSKGIASAPDLSFGNYQYQIVETPENYQAQGNRFEVNLDKEEAALQNLTIQRNEPTTTSQVTTAAEPTTTTKVEASSTTQTEVTTTSQAPQTVEPSKSLKDKDNDGEIIFTESDAKQIASIEIEPINPAQETLPDALKNKDADYYQLTALDKNGVEVKVEGTTLIKLLTRPINSQVQAFSIDRQNKLTPLKLRVNKQIASIESKGMDLIALVYGDQAATPTTGEAAGKTTTTNASTTTTTTTDQNNSKTVVVKKSTDRKEAKKGNLPTTGEDSSRFIYILASALVVGGVILLLVRKRKNHDDPSR